MGVILLPGEPRKRLFLFYCVTPSTSERHRGVCLVSQNERVLMSRMLIALMNDMRVGKPVYLPAVERGLWEVMMGLQRGRQPYQRTDEMMAFKKCKWVDVSLHNEDYDEIEQLAASPMELVSLYLDCIKRGYKVTPVYAAKTDEIRFTVIGVSAKENLNYGLNAVGTDPVKVFACALYKAFVKYEWGSWVDEGASVERGYR